jgi:hypothetical protein
MNGPDGVNQDRSSTASDQDDQPQMAPSQMTSLELVRRVVLGSIQAIGDGAELISTSIAEELVNFRLELEQRVVVLLLMCAGIAALSAGILLFLKELIGNWAATLVIVGAAHIGIGLWLSYRWKKAENSK